jgi:hypothetical protein
MDFMFALRAVDSGSAPTAPPPSPTPSPQNRHRKSLICWERAEARNVRTVTMSLSITLQRAAGERLFSSLPDDLARRFPRVFLFILTAEMTEEHT